MKRSSHLDTLSRRSDRPDDRLRKIPLPPCFGGRGHGRPMEHGFWPVKIDAAALAILQFNVTKMTQLLTYFGARVALSCGPVA